MNHFENEKTIEDIVDSFSARLENGERPSIEEYKKQYPQLAERIEAVLPALVVLENVDSDPIERKLAVDDSIPEVLGDYQIIQEVGRGGMGIVFEAQHTTMRRRVALKVLPKSSAEKPNYLKRFLTEARSAGQLHHTNIVPVFEVGESDGLHFYSMQYIHGDNLDHVIEDIRRLRKESRDTGSLQTAGDRRPYQIKHQSERSHSIAVEMIRASDNGPQADVVPATQIGRQLDAKSSEVDPEKSKTTVFTNQSTNANQRTRNRYHNRVADVGVQVAEALVHAHEHGVLHRDVKPANLILDTDGNVWITDFGLAKLDADDLTQTGDIVGTLRYMAPERFAGEADPRSDIYSLGLTLYELATLKCAFENDRGTLVQDVASSSSVVSPRKIDESIPSDLETIILKSIEPQPERRYQTARELAEDLNLFLADRPIRARRATWAEKFWRICRRNPVASSLSACLAVLLVLVTAGSIQFARNEVRNRKDSQKNLFFAKLDQARMRVYSGRPGQRFEAMKAIKDAVELLPVMEFEQKQLDESRFLLRSEVIAANSLTDIDRMWTNEFDDGWGDVMRFTIDINGKYFAEGNSEGRIRIRYVDDKSILLELPGGRGVDPPWMMHFSPNARYLIAKYHQPNVHNEFLTIVWDIESGGRQRYVTKYTREFCFSKDSRFIAIAYADRVEVVDLESAQVVKTIYPEFSAHANVAEVYFNSDASAVAISRAGSGIVEFWNVKRSPVLTDIVECDESVFCMEWDSEREIFVAGCHRGLLQYWIGDLSNEGQAIHLHQNSIHEIHLHPERELVATTAWDATTRFTDLIAGDEVLRVEDHKLLYNGFCANGRLGMLDDEKRIGIWQVELPLIQSYSSPEETGGGFTCCIHPLHENIVGRTTGENIEFWNIRNRQRLYTIYDHKSKAIAFSDSGDSLFTSGDDGFCRWQVNCDGRSLNVSSRRTLIVRPTGNFDQFQDGERLVIAVGNQLNVVDAYTGELIREIGKHGNLNILRLTADDRYALSGTWHGNGIKVWDFQTNENVQTVNAKFGSASPVPHPVDPTRFFVSRSHTTEFTLSDRVDSRKPAVLRQKLKYEGRVHLVRNGEQMLVQTNSYNLILLNTETQQERAKIVSLGQSRVIDCAVSPDGNTVVLACFDNLQVLDLNDFRDRLVAVGLQ